MVKPFLTVDISRVRNNILRMCSKAESCGLLFRPHFKTHQSRGIGRIFRELGVRAIAVSSLPMARYFADDGWDDITLAFPFIPGQEAEISELAGRINLNVITDSREAIAHLKTDNSVGVFIEVDVGYRRTGLYSLAADRIDSLIRDIGKTDNLTFKGFLCHEGRTYAAGSQKEILDIHAKTRLILQLMAVRLKGLYPDLIVSYGDTPSSVLAHHFDGIDELRPGNFVFFDLMQENLGVCSLEEIAVWLNAPVCSVHRQRRDAVIWGGAVHLSKEFLSHRKWGGIYGLAFTLSDGRPDTVIGPVTRLSQEHGIIHMNVTRTRLSPGDRVAVLPVHSCLAVDLMPRLVSLDGEHFDTFSL